MHLPLPSQGSSISQRPWLLVLFSLSLTTARPWHPNGIYLDPSCDRYTQALHTALSSVLQMARSAYTAAASHTSPYFFMFFSPSDSDMVQQVMLNIAHAVGGHGPAIPIKCNEDNRCLPAMDTRDVGAYVSRRTTNYADDYINICRHSVDGSDRTPPVTNDWCSLGKRNITLTGILFHELMHIYPIADFKETYDLAWGQDECKDLARLNVKDQYGQLIRPTDNAQNYVWFAESQISFTSLYDANKCPQLDKQELRKLLGLDGKVGEVQEVDGSATDDEPKGNATWVVASGQNTSDVVKGP